MKGGDRFFLIFKKIDLKKFWSIHLYWKLFRNITIYQNLNEVFQFCKNWLAVCTLSFNIKAKVIFYKKSVLPHNDLKIHLIQLYSTFSMLTLFLTLNQKQTQKRVLLKKPGKIQKTFQQILKNQIKIVLVLSNFEKKSLNVYKT